jgi:hypothetical protein
MANPYNLSFKDRWTKGVITVVPNLLLFIALKCQILWGIRQ